MRRRYFVPLAVTIVVTGALVAAARAANALGAPAGTAEFKPADGETNLPERFQMNGHSFAFEQKPISSSLKGMKVSAVTFPSPMVTPHEKNNTVHCEYFHPTTPGRKPAVIVLHILGGDFDLARLFGRTLASRGTAALFLKMPYYGERRQPGVDVRMISIEPDQTVRGMTQAVLDIRQAGAWLSCQEDVDPNQLGIMGISLGGITASLAISIEPRFSKACLLLAGGGMGEIAWTSTEMEPLRKAWAAQGRTREELFETVKIVDPVTYARPVPGRKILMLNASHDEVVPPACTKALWRAFGEPEIVWWDAGHYSAVRYIFQGMAKVMQFFDSETPSTAQTIAK